MTGCIFIDWLIFVWLQEKELGHILAKPLAVSLLWFWFYLCFICLFIYFIYYGLLDSFLWRFLCSHMVYYYFDYLRFCNQMIHSISIFNVLWFHPFTLFLFLYLLSTSNHWLRLDTDLSFVTLWLFGLGFRFTVHWYLTALFLVVG